METAVIMGDADYDFLRQAAELLWAAVYQNREHTGLCRTLRLERVVPGDQELVLISHNGYDRRERQARMPIGALRRDLAGTFNTAVAEALSLNGVPRVYFVQSIADEVLAELGLAGGEARREGGVEYATWVDHITDNVLIKAYRRFPRRAALAFCVPREAACGNDDAVREFVRKRTLDMVEIFADEVRLAEAGAFGDEGQMVKIMDLRT